MLQQMIVHTPLWVWAMLAFLLYRGWLATTDREVPPGKVAVVPLLLMGLSGHGLYALAHANLLALSLALLAALSSAGMSWLLAGSGGVTPYPQRGTVFLRGSWFPLLLMVSVFAVKYTMGVLQAMHSPHLQGAGAAAGVSVLYGLFIGVSMGRVLRILHLYRQAQLPAGPLTV